MYIYKYLYYISLYHHHVIYFIQNLISISFIPHHTNTLYETHLSSIQKALGLLNWE